MDELSIHAWLTKYTIKTETGKPIDFRDHLFLFDIYADQSPKLVCFKAAQIGFTTLAVLKTMWLAKMQKMDIIYTNPSDSDSNQFVSGKVQRIIAQNPILQEYVHGKDSVSQKSVGDSLYTTVVHGVSVLLFLCQRT